MGECVECGKPTRNKYCDHWKCRWPNRTYLEHRTKQHILLVMKIRKSPKETHRALATRLGVALVTVATIRRRELEEPLRKQRWIYMEYQGERRTISEWSKITGLTRKTINSRRRNGWPVESILGEPLRIIRGSSEVERFKRERKARLAAERAHILSLIAQNPTLTNEELGKLVSRSESAVSRIRSQALGQPKRKSGRPLPVAKE